MTNVVNNMVRVASSIKDRQAASKINAIIQSQRLLDELKRSSSIEEKKQKQFVLSEFTQTILTIYMG